MADTDPGSAAPPSSSGGRGIGGALKSKLGPLPVWVWLAILTALALAYYLFFSKKKKKASSQQQTMAGQPGVVVNTGDDEDQDHGHGKGKKKKKKHHPPTEPGGTRDIHVAKDETLGQLAKSRHWSQNTLKEVEEMNLTPGQGEWNANTKLTKGEDVLRPFGSRNGDSSGS